MTDQLNFERGFATYQITNLYRNDGPDIFKYILGTEVERTKNELVKIFKNNRLSVTVNTNLKKTNLCDIHFDLVKKNP